MPGKAMPDKHGIEIDLYSDTQSKPTKAMRAAMAAAEVGDEQQGRDPTVSALNERVADLLGKEDALFLPSGTMCNQIALLVHCRPGDEVICDRSSHLINAEGGGGAALAGVMMRGLSGARGVFTAAEAEAAIRPDSNYAPRSRLIEIEQTANLGGGTVWPLDAIRAVAAVARKHRLATHMDGARLMNAVVASGIPAKEYAKDMDTAWLDLTKGLGCPLGAVLAGPRPFVKECWRWKQRIGGSMRQAGIVAAAGLYALDHHVQRLAEDHANAQALAKALAGVPGVRVEPVETNIVFLDIAGTGIKGPDFNAALARHGVRLSVTSDTRVRALTHIDIPAAAIPKAADAIRRVAMRN
ncbi:MAG: threonine aldolase family protein [Rhodospirillales bacterium]